MKFTLSWLKDHLDTDLDAKALGETLTSLGLELESIEDRAASFAPFKVALIKTAEKHPDADRLKVLTVDTGKEIVNVVCGAPNARAGMKGIFAPDGSFIPGTGVTLKKGMIRGQESNGMMVSEREMGLSEDHDGIIEVADTCALGTPFAEVYGLTDPVIDIAVTPNRADCAGVRGVARDLAAKGAGVLKPLSRVGATKGGYPSPVNVSVEGDGCPHFVGRHMRGVRNGSSPEWMQQRLKAIGLRPISALVDITNYLTFDLCRPLHIYDAAKLKGGVTARPAKQGETLDALNGKTYALDEGMTAICDEDGVLALGGIMGGAATGVSDGTTDIFIESAYFDPNRTARTGRTLGIVSDARYRFERGVDPAFTESAMDIVTSLVLELCGGEASEIVTSGHAPAWKRAYPLPASLTEKLTGIAVSADAQKKILERLGFTVEGSDPMTVTPPSWRADILGSADLVEEIARVHGYDAIPALSVRSGEAVSNGAESGTFTRSRKARNALAMRGLQECVTWSFMKRETAALFGSNDNPALTLTNPISSDLAQMRPSILPHLLEAAQKNADKGLGNAALFEVGPIFKGTDPQDQKWCAGGVRFSAQGARHWSGADASRAIDALDAKADALAALGAAGAPAGNLQVSRDAPGHYHPGRSGSLRLGGNVLGYFGELHPALIDTMGVKGPAAAFEVFLDAIPAPKKKPGAARPALHLSALQPVSRDFAFLMAETVEADSLIRAAKSADKTITSVDIFDVYRGKGVEPGMKSVAIGVTIQPKDKTLEDAEIEALSKRIVEAVMAKCGASLRS